MKKTTTLCQIFLLLPLLIQFGCSSNTCATELKDIQAAQTSIFIGELLNLSIEASDPNTCISAYKWQASGGSIDAEANSNEAQFSAPCQAGKFTIMVEALDANGKTLNSATIDIEVAEKAPFNVSANYVPSGFFDDVSSIATRETEFNGENCTEFSFSPYGTKGYGGVYWQYPPNNWGVQAGMDLSGYEKVSFYVCSPDNATVNFIAGGVADSSLPNKDRFKKVTGFQELGPDWQKIEIDLKGADLSSVIGGLAWTTNREYNPRPVKFYIRDIQYERYPCQ